MSDDIFDIHKSLSTFDAQWDDLLNTTRSATPTKVSDKIATARAAGATSRANAVIEEESSDEEDDDFDEQEKRTAREIQKKETISTLGNKLSILVSQLDDLRYKYKRSKEHNDKMEVINKELMSQIDTLEEENSELHESLKEKLEDAKKHKMIGGAGAAKKKGEGRNLKNTAQKKDHGFNLALISDGDADDHHLDVSMGGSTKSIIEKYAQKFFDYVPFKRDIQEVRSTFGGATASYFTFFRWMLFNFLVMGLWGCLFSAIHIVRMIVRGDITKVAKGDSILPGFMNYSSFETSESLTYAFNVIFGVFILLLFCAHKTIMEDRQMKRLDVIEQQNDYTFSKDILCRWDNTQFSETEVLHSYGLIELSFKEKLAESEKAGRIVQRTRGQLVVLYSKRFLVFILYCCIQVASYATIIWLTIKSESVQNFAKAIPVLRNLTDFIVPGAVTTINAMTPAMYKHLTRFEEWDSGQFALNVLILRMYLSNMMNLLILALSYSLLADPYMMTEDSNSEQRGQLENVFDEAIYSCRMNAAAEGLFSLVMSEFVVNAIIFFLVGYVPVAINRYIRPFKKFEMNIAQRMVALLYFISLMMLAFPFSPLVVMIMPIMMAFRIKWEKSMTLKYYAKPKDLWQAHKAGSFFVLFYMASLTLVALPAMILFLSQHTFAKDCSKQDDFIDLCTDAVDESTNLCTLDTTSVHYDYFSNTDNCPEGYPACVCLYRCGAFVDLSNAFQSLRSAMYKFSSVKAIWQNVIAPSYFAWWLVGFFYVFSRLRKNTIAVTGATYAESERGYEAQIMSLENEKKQHTKLINRLKLLEK
mmetsp:Transcript_4778/g.9008  ORF Transcript_4778/g.9008 Transcript_4778/m.9008 type:complete len:814 (+) Transcript_4778:117-2558(+)